MNIFRFIVLFTYLFSSQAATMLAEEVKDEITQNYGGLPGCECFLHCTYVSQLPQPKRKSSPCTICGNGSFDLAQTQDEIWHHFIDGLQEILRDHKCYSTAQPPSIPYYKIDYLLNTFGYKSCNGHCMLSDYLNSCERFFEIIKYRRNYCVVVDEEMAKNNSRKYGGAVLKEAYKRADRIAKESVSKLCAVRANILRNYRALLIGCWHSNNPRNLAYIYNRGLLSITERDYENSLTWLQKFIEFCKQHNREDLLTSGIYCSQGKVYYDVGRYNEAIKALSIAIDKDSKNKDAYFERAKSYFESGEFEHAIADYLSSDTRKRVLKEKRGTSYEFEKALLTGILEESQVAIHDFGALLCDSVHGLNRAFWIFADHPVDATTNFVNACYDMAEESVQYFKKLRKEDLEEMCDEMRQLYEYFNTLDDKKKGMFIGRIIGRFGTDAFAGGMIIRGVAEVKHLYAAKRLQNANIICNLETLAASKEGRKIVAAAGLDHNKKKIDFFKNVKIEVDKQNKHIFGKHNYIEGKSILEHPNPQELLEKFAGTGIPRRGIPGTPGYKELVDFNEFIGYNVAEGTGIKTPTTWGTIHYSKSGAHIVPYLPKE